MNTLPVPTTFFSRNVYPVICVVAHQPYEASVTPVAGLDARMARLTEAEREEERRLQAFEQKKQHAQRPPHRRAQRSLFGRRASPLSNPRKCVGGMRNRLCFF